MTSQDGFLGVPGHNDIYDQHQDGSSTVNSFSTAGHDSESDDSEHSTSTYATSMRSLHRRQTDLMLENAQAALATRTRRSLIAADPDFLFTSDVRAGSGSVVSSGTVASEKQVEFYKMFVPDSAVDSLLMVQSRIGPSYRTSGFVPKTVHDEFVEPSMRMIANVFVNGTPAVHKQRHGPFMLHVNEKALTLSLIPSEPLFARERARESLGLNYVEVQIEEDSEGVEVERIVHPRLASHENTALALPITHVPVFLDMGCLNNADVTDITISTSEGTQGITFPHGMCMVLYGLGKILDGKRDGSVSLKLVRCFLTSELFAALKSKAVSSLHIEQCGILGQCTLPKMSRLVSLHFNAFGLLNASVEVDMLNLPLLRHFHADTRFRFVVRRTATKPVDGDAYTAWESASVLCIRNPNGRMLKTLVLCVTHADVEALVGPDTDEAALVDPLFRMRAKQFAVEAVQSSSQFQMMSMSDPNCMPERRSPFVTSPFDVNLSPFNTATLQEHHLSTLVPRNNALPADSVLQARILSEYTQDLLLTSSLAQILWGRLAAMGAKVVSVGPTLSVSMGFNRFGRSLGQGKEKGEAEAKRAALPEETMQRSMFFSQSREGPSVVILGLEFYMSPQSVWVPDAAKNSLWTLRYPLALANLGTKRSASKEQAIYQVVVVDRRMFLLRADTRTPMFNETALIFCRPDSDVHLPANAVQVTSEDQLTTIRTEMAAAMDRVYPIVEPPSMCSNFRRRYRSDQPARTTLPNKK